MQEEKPQIDQMPLSRQLAVYGAEAQGKLMSMRVFIHGLSGVYLYIKSSFLSKVKNLILAGPNKSHFDQTIVTIEDVGRNFIVVLTKSNRPLLCEPSHV